MENVVCLLGSGTCRVSPRRNSCSVVSRVGSRVLLFDAGASALGGLAATGVLSKCSELHVHISHRHTDHLLGLFALLQSLSWSDDAEQLAINKVVIHCTQEVAELITGVRRIWGEGETSLKEMNEALRDRQLELLAGPDHEDWAYCVGDLEVQSVHLPGDNNHGIKFSLDDRVYALAGDATQCDASLARFCRGADLAVIDIGHLCGVYKPIDGWVWDDTRVVNVAVESQTPVLVATHIYLRHLQHQPLTEMERQDEVERLISDLNFKARSLGYAGIILDGQDGMALQAI